MSILFPKKIIGLLQYTKSSAKNYGYVFSTCLLVSY